jgi:hypothetical protein
MRITLNLKIVLRIAATEDGNKETENFKGEIHEYVGHFEELGTHSLLFVLFVEFIANDVQHNRDSNGDFLELQGIVSPGHLVLSFDMYVRSEQKVE